MTKVKDDGSTTAFDPADIEAQVQLIATTDIGKDAYDWDLEREVQTSKSPVKLVPCRECRRPLVVSTFYVPANARCTLCKGESGAGRATVGTPQPGRTDPAQAVDLTKTLINPHFAMAICPVHPDDPEHEMELKSVTHNDNYGPSEHMGKGEYRQIAPGETAMHQCTKCKAVVTYTTTAQTQFRRINEPKLVTGVGANQWSAWLGAREESQ